jgi:hypothetical protein
VTACSLSHSAVERREGLGSRRARYSDQCIPKFVLGPDQKADRKHALGGLLHPWPSDKCARDPRRAGAWHPPINGPVASDASRRWSVCALRPWQPMTGGVAHSRQPTDLSRLLRRGAIAGLLDRASRRQYRRLVLIQDFAKGGHTAGRPSAAQPAEKSDSLPPRTKKLETGLRAG